MTASKGKVLICLLSSLSAVACSNDMSDLEQYKQQVKNKYQGSVEPLPQFKPPEIHSFRAERNPFEPLGAIDRKSDNKDAGRDTAFLNRALEPLEYFPLDSLSMVGTLDRGGIRWGLIKDAEGKIHRVKAGNHIGQDYGAIANISSTSITVTELIQDSTGLWAERESQLHIGE